MNCKSAQIALFPRLGLASMLLFALTASAFGQSPFDADVGVLVLRNGQILEGEIIRHGDSYLVRVAQGSEIRIPSADVRIQSRSLEDAYQRQRETLGPVDVLARLRLASWCLRAELPHRAADQLLAVRLIDPKHDGLAAVERRLEAWQMAQMAAERPAPKPKSTATENNPYDTSRLDAVVEELPTEAVELFAARVQPLLSNRCGAAGCHGFATKTDFQLLRPSFQNTFTRRYTQRNLIAALGHIERSLPEESPLLTKARQVHGGEREPALLERRDMQNDLLAKWIYAVAGKEMTPAETAEGAAETIEPESPKVVNPAVKELLQKRKREIADASVRQATFDEPVEEEPSRDEPPAGPRSFDPAIFNRRYHGRP